MAAADIYCQPNVAPESFGITFIEALYAAGKRTELITLSSTHMVPEPRLAYLREKAQVDFFRQHLSE